VTAAAELPEKIYTHCVKVLDGRVEKSRLDAGQVIHYSSFNARRLVWENFALFAFLCAKISQIRDKKNNRKNVHWHHHYENIKLGRYV
jgi:hypothetical protein